MIAIEIPPNANCDAVDMRVFHDVEPPRPVSRMRLEREGSASRWYDVTGWTSDGNTQPALAQKVDDSGEGVIFLIRGGDAGLRFRPAGSPEPWRLGRPDQWGLPFLLMPDLADVTFEKSA